MGRWLSRVLLIGVVVLGPGLNGREDHYSCHLCRGLKEVRSTRLLLWVVWREEIPVKVGGGGTNHQHQWWRYSYYFSNGPLGCLGEGVVCHTNGRYRDEQSTGRLR